MALGTVSAGRRIAAFVILFALYQSAEGVGMLWLHSPALQAVLMIAALLAAWPVGRWLLGHRGYDAYALDLKPGWARLVLVGILLAALARLAAVFWGLANGTFVFGPPPASLTPIFWIGMVAGAALSTFVASITEDILTRGFWLKASGVAWTGSAFVLASSAIYLLNHIYRLGDGPLAWMRIFCFGLAYAAAAWRWKSLWAAVGLHWGWNLTNTLLDGVVTIDAARPDGPPWLSAGAHLVLTAIVLLWPVQSRIDSSTSSPNGTDR
jgi:hypothetical protein